MFADSSSSGPIFGKNPSTYSRRDARRARKRGGPSAESCVRCLLLFSRTTADTGNTQIDGTRVSFAIGFIPQAVHQRSFPYSTRGKQEDVVVFQFAPDSGDFLLASIEIGF